MSHYGLGLNSADPFTFNIEDFINPDSISDPPKEGAAADNKAWADPSAGSFNGVSTAFDCSDGSIFTNLLSDQFHLGAPS